ncbi:hypothetical protein WICPIJ_005721 [Wickerhamomyces pijperi]|uniref:Uncharacterized protein n=1 Tax=Wickerhamomyces pijperi TaxID=599730 RepID=A0A9P8Q5D4_WICPI|nr:hypothetical protein WICPIJ_005721 [Wickerhamomyces pijperi]
MMNFICSYNIHCSVLSTDPKYDAKRPLYNAKNPSFLTMVLRQSMEFLYCLDVALSSCKRVLIIQIGFVAVDVAIPAVMAAIKWIHVASWLLLKFLERVSLQTPYVKKLIDLAGMTPAKFGPRPLNKAVKPSVLRTLRMIPKVSLKCWAP